MNEGQVTTQVLLQKANSEVWELAVLDEATISFSKNTASSISLNVWRDSITSEVSESLIFTVDGGHHMIWGFIKDAVKEGKYVNITAYDQMEKLANNDQTFNYGVLSLSEFFKRLCDDFQVDCLGDVMNTECFLPEIIMDSTILLDAIIEGINTTYNLTGKKFYVHDACKNLCLHSEEFLKIPAEEMTLTSMNIENKSMKESIPNDFCNRVTVRCDDAEASIPMREFSNEESIKRYGLYQDNVKIQKDVDIDQYGKNYLKEHGKISYSYSITGAIGNPKVIGGSLVFVDFFSNGYEDAREYVRGWFSVESGTHHFKNGFHTMDLELSLVEMVPLW